MAALLGGSLLLTVVSSAAIVIGWLNSSAVLIYLSIACSVGVGLCLALAYGLSRVAVDAAGRARRGSAPGGAGPAHGVPVETDRGRRTAR
jgi:hypothetical protein